jgi:hypothetical protein
MRGSESYQRLSWADRFQEPSVRQLREGLPPGTKRLFDAIHKRLLEIDGVQ